MPAPGEQYNGGDVKNPFEERVVNGFTAVEIATLQSRLNKQLGPEYLSQRPGNGGGRVAYLEGNKAIALANEVFGFNGWSSSLGQVQIDYVDENAQGKVSLGLSIVVRITLKDGTYHEDIGYGSIENGKGKAASFEKAKKEAATDGLKRALRTFGNVLGNCLYDKEYLKKVQAMKVKPIKFNQDNLHRHSDFAPPVEEEAGLVKREPHQTPVRPNQVLRTRTEHLGGSMSGEFDDEFDGNLFDGVEITEHQGDEYSFDTVSGAKSPTKALEVAKPASAPQDTESNRSTPTPIGGPPRQPNPQTTSAMRHPQQPPPQKPQQNQGPGRPPMNQNISRGPQTPVQQQSNARPDLNRPRMPPPTVDIHAVPKPQNPPQQQANQNQPLRPTHPQAQAQVSKPGPQGTTTPAANHPPNHRPPVGFVTSRAAELMQNSDSTASLTHIPAFNPHVDSPVPKEQRTPGIDHTRSIPIKRTEIGAPAPPPPAGNASQPNLQPNANAHPGTGGIPGGGFGRLAMAGRGNMNFVNPAQDTNRRIGMPGAAMSPGMNRSAYKPPTKRPPLVDVSNQAGPRHGDGEPEAKRQRVDGPVPVAAVGVENAAPGAVGT